MSKKRAITADITGNFCASTPKRRGFTLTRWKCPTEARRTRWSGLAESDLQANKDKKFDWRFLNIKNPWKDKRLENWKGYGEVRWYDEENREVEPDTPNAKPKTLIPLALYGLDYPKIPTILVDFRDSHNPKIREMSKRVLDDVMQSIFSVSKFGNMPYFFGHFFYDFVTARRGIDFNQASRFRSYSQLKLLLSLNESLDADFKGEIANRLEKVSLNPLENDPDAEIRIARQQYKNLIEYAKRPGRFGEKDRKRPPRRNGPAETRRQGSGCCMRWRIFSRSVFTHTAKTIRPNFSPNWMSAAARFSRAIFARNGA